MEDKAEEGCHHQCLCQEQPIHQSAYRSAFFLDALMARFVWYLSVLSEALAGLLEGVGPSLKYQYVAILKKVVIKL
jgi:hypothetical protein